MLFPLEHSQQVCSHLLYTFSWVSNRGGYILFFTLVFIQFNKMYFQYLFQVE